jgi:O-antigen ligase
MIENRYLRAHPRAWLAVHAVALVVFVAILVPLVSGGTGILFLTALLGGIGAFWLMQKPHWGVLIIQALMFVEFDFLFGATYVVSAVLLLPFAWVILRERGTWLLQVPQIQILLTIALLFIVSTLWSEFKYPVTLYPEKDQTTKLTREFITHLGWLVFFLYFINTRQKIELTAKLTVGLICAAAISALFLFVSSGGAGRAAASFSMAKNSNRLAYICMSATCLIWFYRYYAPTRRWKLLTLPLLVILPLASLASGSRGGLLQMAALAAAIVKDQKGWSPAKRISCILSMGLVAVLTVAVVPSAYLERATNFDTAEDSAGQESLQNRTRVALGALQMIATDPIFGAGYGNYPWVARAYLGVSGATHNSYLWAFTSGGVGVFASYLLLFYVTYRMLKRLERVGPQELLWLVKATKVNLLLFLICSISTDFWLSDFLYLIVGLTVAMAYLPQHREQISSSPAPVRSPIFNPIGQLAPSARR